MRGASNPQRLTNPVWQWLIASRITAYEATHAFSGAGDRDGPGWCFSRYGQSSTLLPDGRTIFIAGEHEDHYDPDFYIYNDVVIVGPDAEVEILGYPTGVFPPTDFHSATRVDDRIVLIGNLGYPGDRHQGITQVVTLETTTWRAALLETHGQGPGWLHDHHARLTPDGHSIVVSGGKVDRRDGLTLVENIDEWQLHLDDWRWERLTTRRWPRFEVFRTDRQMLHLWQMRNALFSKQMRWDDFDSLVQALGEQIGGPPQLDIVPSLYRPALAHDALPADEQDHRVHRIRIGEWVVRYFEDAFSVQATVEGELPADKVADLRSDLIAKLAALERTAIAYRDIEPV